MNNRPQHTFTWLKVFVVVFAIELAIVSIFLFSTKDSHDDTPNFLLIPLPVACWAAVGLVIGLLLNAFTKFRWPRPFYLIGHVLSVPVVYIAVSLFALTDNQKASPMKPEPVSADTASSIFKADEKHAIEEVLYLMEQQYPLGAYELVDIVTKAATNGTICTIVFTLPEEDHKKYISQYLIKEGTPEPVYTKQDTTSAAYAAYKQEKMANRY